MLKDVKDAGVGAVWLGAAVATFVEVLGHLAGVTAAVGAALLHRRALAVLLAALHASGREAARLLRRWAVALLHPLHRLEELAAGKALVVLLGKQRLGGGGRGREKKRTSDDSGFLFS